MHVETKRIDSFDSMMEVAKALSNKNRIAIIKELLPKYTYTDAFANLIGIRLKPNSKAYISELADKIKCTQANISSQIKILDNAGLVNCEFRKGKHGVRKEVSLKYPEIVFRFCKKYYVGPLFSEFSFGKLTKKDILLDKVS